ncbi:hypothetical protein TRAPUB_12865 [Trametes pubescens]|uniref:Uncharacterized protein n=1 Tax=Trametes pubescens TaxID=154538 RepID=A0A1M2VSQ0_TRAPU|nr:hypothetical protein TRAPUB_12865 [Trametes pubescens]
MLCRSLSVLPVLLLTLFLLVAHSPVSALSIPPNLKAPRRVKSLRGPDQHLWTNAQRLAVGLPPRAPRIVKRATSTSPLEPAPVKRTAPSPSASPFAYSKARPAVDVSYSGRIVARYAGTDVPIGYVRSSSSGVSLGDDEDGARVAFTASGPRALFSISAVDAAVTTDDTASAQNTAFIGAAGTAALAAGSPSAVLLNSVQQTSAHARPAAAGGESAIWMFDAATQALTAHWVNPDGSHPRTRVAVRARDGALVLTGDVGAYNEAHKGDVVYEVTLHLDSD